MFRLVVLLTVVAVAVARPGFLHGGLGYSAIAAPVLAVPAVSHSYRTDIISKPIVAVPVIRKTIVAAPVAYAPHPVVAYSGHLW